LAVLAACGLIVQTLTSGLALGACASPDPADGPADTAVHAPEPGEEPHGSGGHRGQPDCCFFACHLIGGKLAPSAAPVVLATPEPAQTGLIAPHRSRRIDAGDERLPQNPRAPPLPA
jgi:hypothetical protein